MTNNEVYHFMKNLNLSIQHHATITIGNKMRGSYCDKLYQELGMESLQSSHFYKILKKVRWDIFLKLCHYLPESAIQEVVIKLAWFSKTPPPFFSISKWD